MARTPKPSITRTSSSWMVLFVLLPTCGNEAPAPVSKPLALPPRIFKPAPADEVASWRRVLSSVVPEARFLQALAFDETRGLVVMFGGLGSGTSTGWNEQSSQDLWEWSPATGRWTQRPTDGTVPAPRGGAAMVFDPVRNKILLFGGQAASGYDYEDLWEWNPTTGTWTDRTGIGKHPAARAQHAMLYQKSTNRILLFGGGRSKPITGAGASASFGDTWELDPATGTWTALATASSPSVRHDSGLVWDSARNKAVLFGGLQIDAPDSAGMPKQDTWEWDPSAHTWTERASTGNKPEPRFAHAMAYDAVRGRVVVFGGTGTERGSMKNDMWEWDPTTGVWTQARTGAEAGMPAARSYSSMVYDQAHARLELVAGAGFCGDTVANSACMNQVWEVDTAAQTFTDRTVADPGPSVRGYHAMAYNPATGKVYLYGGENTRLSQGKGFADFWEWDGASWSEIVTDTNPEIRIDAAMAYDPARRSLILFGGSTGSYGFPANDTWEWNGDTRQWSRLSATGSPSKRWGHGMVADTMRKKILLFGGSTNDAGDPSPQSDIWEWDGALLTWTNRTPPAYPKTPKGRIYPVMSFDETRGKLVLYDGNRDLSVDDESTSAYWEWDGASGGWSLHDPNEASFYARNIYAVHDPIRRRHVFFTDASSYGYHQMRELDANLGIWYTRELAVTPSDRAHSGMVFDSGRGVAVVFGGNLWWTTEIPANDTWEYTVKNLANGEGCTAASASTCASGQCVDGVCCASAGCTGACMACNVRGSEGTCVLAQAGTEVPGSCSNGQACDGTGTCKSKNGQACGAASQCASGFCVDGVCCDGACDGACKACNLAGSLGTCTPQAAGKDPDNECGQGTGACNSSCDGAGACAFPLEEVCGACLLCDGAGACTRTDPACSGTGGSTGRSSSTAKSVPRSGGAGGLVKSSGGVGGKSEPRAGGNGGNVTTSPVGSGGISGGGVGGTSWSSPGAFGGGVGGAGSSMAGSPIQGGSGASSSGSSNLALDAGAGPEGSTDAQDDGRGRADAGAPDGGLVSRLSPRGCRCDLGRGESMNPSLIWTLLVGARLLTWRPRRRQRSR